MKRFLFTAALVGTLGVLFFIVTKDNQAGSLPSDVPKQDSSAAFILPASQPDYFPLRDFNVDNPDILAKSAVLFDTRSGKFLFQKNLHTPLPIASLTKLMTAVVLLENLDMAKNVKVSVENVNVDGFGADLYRGEVIKGSELLKLMLIKSSNDAALMFGTEAGNQGIDLVKKMNEKAVELGMNSTNFTNPAGLDDNAFSTASDLVKLVQYVSRYHETIWNILKIKSLDVASVDGGIVHHLINTDQLLGQMTGIIGGKTGFTSGAMGTMILVVDVDDGYSNLVGVILGSNDRFSEVKSLIDWGRKAYRWK